MLSLQPQSTGVPKALAIPCPCRARRHNWLKIMAKVARPSGFRLRCCPGNWKLAQTRTRRLRVPSAAALARRLRLFALGRPRMSSSCNILNGRVFAHTDVTARDEGAVRSHCTICPDLDIGRSQEGAAKFDFAPVGTEVRAQSERADMPRASGACRSDKNRPCRTSFNFSMGAFKVGPPSYRCAEGLQWQVSSSTKPT